MTLTDKVIELNDKIEQLEKQIDNIVKDNKETITLIEQKFNIIVTEQRELIINLVEQLKSEREDKKIRFARALEKLKVNKIQK